jgi:hypothetical protein
LQSASSDFWPVAVGTQIPAAETAATTRQKLGHPSEIIQPAGRSSGLSIAQLLLAFAAMTVVGLAVSLIVSPI